MLTEDLIRTFLLSADDPAPQGPELEAYARRHGFKGAAEYLEVSKLLRAARQKKFWEKNPNLESINAALKRQAEAQLKNPNLDPAARKRFEEQLRSIQSAQEFKTVNLSDADMALYAKYKDQVDAALLKVRA